MGQDTTFRFPRIQRSGLLVVEQREFSAKLGGVGFHLYEHTLPQGSNPIEGEYGIFEPYIFNERNSTESRQRFLVPDINAGAQIMHYRLDTDGSVVKGTNTLSEFGTTEPVSSLNTIKQTVERLDGNHELVVKESVEEWAEVKSYQQAVAQYGLLDIELTEQKVAPTNPGNSGADGVTSQGETDARMLLRKTEVTTTSAQEKIVMRDWVPKLQATYVYQKSEMVGTQETPALTYLDVAVRDEKVAHGKKLRTRFAVTGWLTFTDTEEEPETGALITVNRYIRDAATYAAAVVAGSEVTSKRVDRLRVEEVIKTISMTNLAQTFRSSKNIQYRFPGWLVPGEEYHIHQSYHYTSGMTTYPVKYVTGLNMKPGQVLTVSAEMFTTYHTIRPIQPTIFQFLTSSIQVNVNNSGLATILGATGALAVQLFGRDSLTISEVITDAAPLLWTSNQTGGIFKWQTIGRTGPTWLQYLIGSTYTHTKTLDIPESSPNATRYIEMMENNEKVLVGVDITKWRFNLWKQVRTYIAIPNLITPGVAA